MVYQAAVFGGRFVGFADFLVRGGEQYRVADTELACSARSPRCCSWRPRVDNFEVGRMTREMISASARSRDRHADLGRAGSPSVRAIADSAATCPCAHERS